MAGALMWVGYGLVIGASPVVVANLAVFAAAGWTLVRPRAVESGADEARNAQDRVVTDRRPGGTRYFPVRGRRRPGLPRYCGSAMPRAAHRAP